MDGFGEAIKKHLFSTWWKQRGWAGPVEITDAEGVYLREASGRVVLDFSSQLMCSNLGHKNRAVIDAIVEQARLIPYLSPAFAVEVRARATEALMGVLPRGLEKVFYSTSGSEANEAAISIALSYKRATGAYKIISRYASYHGSTAGAISCTGDPRRWKSEPSGKMPGVVFAPDCYCYRCPFGLDYPGCGVACAEYVKYMIENEGNVAAIIVEPVVGTNGVIVPVDEYLPRLKRIAEDCGALFIADEVMSGWGRTGAWFACEHWAVLPDILTTAKGCTGAYSPLGITAVRREIAEGVEESRNMVGHTYEAHPLALAPLPAAIAEYKRLGLIENAKKMEGYVKQRLDELKERHPSVGDVRGKGLFWAVELTRDRKRRLPFNTRADKASGARLMVDRLAEDMYRRGVYIYAWVNHLVIAPPLIIRKEELDQGIEALDKSLEIADRESLGQ